MNATAAEQLQSLLDRRPFSVLGFSAADSVWCPTCLRFAAGLSPALGSDYDGKPILPLYARDATVREQICDNCGEQLVDLLLAHQAVRPQPAPVTAILHVYGQRCALSFDRVPPSHVRVQLKQGAWRWDSQLRLWWCTSEKPDLPAGLTLPPDHEPARASIARDPIRRRRPAAPPDAAR